MENGKLEALEAMVEDLANQVHKNHVILFGDPSIHFNAGVMARLEKMEQIMGDTMGRFDTLTAVLETQTAHAKQQAAIEAAAREEREKIINNMWRAVKIFGPVLGTGLFADLAVRVAGYFLP